MREQCNWRHIGIFVVITMCLVGMMSPAMTQPSIPMFNNASTTTSNQTLSPTSSQDNASISSPTPTPTPSHAAPTITPFAPSSPVPDTEGALRTFNITYTTTNVIKALDTGTQTLNESDKSLTDLAVASIEIETECGSSEHPCYRYAGYALNVTAIIANLGAVNASNFVVKFCDDDAIFNETEVSHLQAGSFCIVNASWDLSDADIGIHIITVEVEPCNNSDSNPTNNINRLEWVGIANPWEINMTAPVTPVKEGDNVPINVCIRNKGPLSANLSLNFSCLDSYENRILFDTKPLRVDANSTNYTDATWDARPLFIGPPDNISTTRTIVVEEAKADLHTREEIEVMLSSNLTITAVTINPLYHTYNNETANVVTFTINNNDNETANATLWLYDVNTTAHKIAYSSMPELLRTSYPGALSMSVYFVDKSTYYEAGPGCWYEVYDMNDTIIMNERRSSSTKKREERGDIWSKWGAGDTITLKYYRIEATVEPVALLKCMPLTVNASETKKFAIPYELSQPGVHTLWLVLSNGNNAFTTVGGTDLAVNLSVNETVLDGDPLNITARIKNLESINATNFCVRFYIDSSIIHEESIPYLSGVEYPDNSTTICVSWNATTWDAGKGKDVFNHIIKVEINPCENIDNYALNNEEERIVQVYNDFAVTCLNISHDLSIGESAAINSTIQYLGNRSSSTNVRFYVKKGEDIKRLISSAIISFDDSDGSVTNWTAKIDNSTNLCARVTNVTTNWTVDVSGNCTITVEVEPGWDVNKTNNKMSITREITAPDFVLDDLRIEPESPIEGNTASISVTVNNTGGIARATNIAFYDCFRKPSDYYISMFMNPTEYGIKTTSIVRNKNDTLAMRLYVKFTSYGEYLHLYDSKGRLMATYNESFRGWTPWIRGNLIEVGLEKPKGSSSSTKVTIYNYDYLMPEDEIVSRPVVINTPDARNITINWSASPAGEHCIVAIINPEDAIPEINETNNVQMDFCLVQGPDLIVSDIKLLNITDGSELNLANISADEHVNISANISNIGVLPAYNFNVSFFIDELCVGTATHVNVAQNESTLVSTCWNTTVGNYNVIVMADSGNDVAETNESNNSGEICVKVLGANLAVDIAFNTSTDGDKVMVTANATVTNQGVSPANNFYSFLFLGLYKNERGYEVIPSYYGADDVYKGVRWVNRSYAGANCICVHVNATEHLEKGEKVYRVKEGGIKIYDGKGEEVAKPTEPCCVPVMGDTVNVSVLHGEGQGVEIFFYPGEIRTKNRSLGVDDKYNLLLVEAVGKGIYTACVDADTEGEVPEHDEHNNQQVKQLKVLPDFIVSNISISGNGTGLNETNEGSTVFINASITNSGLISGVTDADVFAVHDWVGLSPRFELSPYGYPYGYGYVITHPGADAIKIHFKSLNITTKNAPCIENRGFVYIRDKTGKIVEQWGENRRGPANSSWITGDTAYVYAPTKCGDITASNVVIDKYQWTNRIANIPRGELQAKETKNYTVVWTPADAGPYAIQMINDPENNEAEMNESNNDLNNSFYLMPDEDPAVVDITFYPQPPVPKNRPVNITAQIVNNGNRTANFSVDLWALKEENYDYETAHPTDDFNETIVTYPEANWTGILFAKILLDEGSIRRRMKVDDLYKNTDAYFYSFNGKNMELWTKGNTTKIEMRPFNSVNYNDRETTEADGGRKVWGCNINRVAHKIILNHTAVSLGPGNTTNVTGILPHMRAGNGSISYMIYAVVDRDNVLCELNESNNELSKPLNAEIPDLTISNITCDAQPKAVIKNIGSAPAENVSVRFIRDVYTGDMAYPPYKVENDGFFSISQKDAKVMRVHFDYLYIDKDKNGSLRIGNGTSWVDYKKDSPKGFWSSWIELDSEGDFVTHPITLILNKGRYEIDRYEYGVDKPDKPFTIYPGAKRSVEVPFTAENEIYNLTVLVDPENRVKESDEGNNDEKKEMGPDLTFAFPEITFLNKKGNEVGSDKLIARESHTIRVNVKNAGCIAAADFYVKLYVNKSYNATYDKQIPGFPMSEQITRLEPGKSSKIDFSWTPQEEGFYRVKVTVDENNDVTEIREENNVFCCSDEVKVGKPGYRAKSDPLPIYKHGTLNGGIIYEPYGHYVSLEEKTNTSYDYSNVFGIEIPQEAEIEVARLYLYLWADKADREHPGFRIGCLPEVKVTFNGEEIMTTPRTYEDTSGATAQSYTYATSCYDVTSACNGKKWRAEAQLTRKEPMRVGINGMALLVVYKDSNSVLTSYWIGEGSDVLMAKNLNFPTGFEFEECTRKCVFDDVGDAEVANASLLTVLTPYVSYDATKLLPEAGGEGDLLRFGRQEVANLISDTTGHWAYRNSIAFTENEWEYVYVKDGTNIAEIQSRGNYFVLKHAILKVEYLPELVAPYIQKSVVVGLPITVEIENKGKSKAGKFNVSFYVDGVLKEKKHFGGIPGESREEWTLPWTPYRVGQLARLNISVDCDNDVRELNENNNNVSQLVAVVDMLPLLPDEGGSSSSAWRRGSGPGEGTGGGPGAGTIVGTGGKTTTGGKSGKTISGRLMKGTVARSEEQGGGGKVKFSILALLMRLAMIAVAGVLFYVGCLWGRRWHRNIQ
uniref:CARDB domain-containing protein n=1 Tax=Candidatus Methanophaga sp. ANME-1 ERB7 TaxID=2759913 RepID=A0A7G9ZDE6_9EURY|nr:hypothetical protein BFNMBJLP_00014 [Methanosarcinales archaeon ANME-1 ERB7]